ncbi:MAG: pyridoxamine 5'-phosphate oxidase family protein [Gemmatimonadetes bacterium]|nr:pyridoxamine 5'-phosphate oxidase family protein [Gemmatimonadota bacterium]
MEPRKKTARVTVKRHGERGRYDRDTVDAILAEGLVAHVGYLWQGQPFVIPTLYARIDDTIYFHGALANRMLDALAEGAPVCVTVTLLDGLVMARSHYNHSANYRSVVVLGRPREVTDPVEKARSLEALVDQVAPGRWADARQPNETESKVTRVIAVPMEEVSAKVRSGPPIDDEADLGLPVWAGVVPLRTVALDPVEAPGLDPGLRRPEYLTPYRRPGW